MTDQVRSQIFGLSLAAATAIGCLAYERLTKAFCFFTVGFLACLAYLPFFTCSLYFTNTVKEDWKSFGQHKWAIALYILSGVTGPLWYTITRTQNMMIAGTYEIKYILVLALFYVVFGAKPFTLNTFVGICFALASIYFISKSK